MKSKAGEGKIFRKQPRQMLPVSHILGYAQSIILRKHTSCASSLARLQINQWKVFYLVRITGLPYQFFSIVRKKTERKRKRKRIL